MANPAASSSAATPVSEGVTAPSASDRRHRPWGEPDPGDLGPHRTRRRRLQRGLPAVASAALALHPAVPPALAAGLVDATSLRGADSGAITIHQEQPHRPSPDGRGDGRAPLPRETHRSFGDGPQGEAFGALRPGQVLLGRTPIARSPDQTQGCMARQAPRLAAAVNDMRRQQGRPAFLPLPASLADRNCHHLAPLLQRLLSGAACDHDREVWQTLQTEREQVGGLVPLSELIACPYPGDLDANEVVRLWLGSPVHARLLLARPRASHLDCAELTLRGRTAAMCTTWGDSLGRGAATRRSQESGRP